MEQGQAAGQEILLQLRGSLVPEVVSLGEGNQPLLVKEVSQARKAVVSQVPQEVQMRAFLEHSHSVQQEVQRRG